MLKKLSFTLVLLVFLFTSVQAGDSITPTEAQTVAQDLIQRIEENKSTHPDQPESLPKLEGTRLGDPLLVHSYPDLRPGYYVVPVVNSEEEISCLIGTSAETRDWQWFSSVQLKAFPMVSKSQAHRISLNRAQGITVSEPKLVEMSNKKLYWLCLIDYAGLKEIFVYADDPSEVHTNLDPDISRLTTHIDPIRLPAPGYENGSETSAVKSYTYPQSYNIPDVPFYYQETSWYCGEAALKMVFDYWGPTISQTHIGDVANESPSYGTYNDDLRRASHFSYVSTAVQNPSLEGYNERGLGYSSCEVWWSDSPHYDTRYDDLKELISHDYPILVLTWYSSSHSSGHYRVVKGYDDGVSHFIVHDPWYSSPYYGPDVHFSQVFFVDNLWAYSGRWGLLSAPWQVDLTVPSVVGTDRTFTVGISIAYTAFHPFENQFQAGNTSATISSPLGYTLLSSSTIAYGSQYSGFAADSNWQMLAPSSAGGPDTIRIEVKGLINGYSGSYGSYQDWIGATAEAVTTVVPFICGDVTLDQVVDLSDAIYLLNYLFKSGNTPDLFEAADVNIDSVIDIADVVFLLNFLFKNGTDPCE